MSLYMVVLLVSIALAVSLTLGAATPIFAQSASMSQLPATVPGLTRDEGVFLITAADDGSRAAYFIAQNTRHSIVAGDLQLEQQLNPLWPVRSASRDEVLLFPEAAPIGRARTGLITIAIETVEAEEMASPEAEAPSTVADEAPSPVAEAPSPAVEAESPVAEDVPGPVANVPASSPMPHATLQPINLQPAAAQGSLDLLPAPSEPTVYVLQSGDNLTRLSARFGTTIQAILAANSIANPSRIFVGQSLVIPSSAPKPDVVESPTAPAPIANEVQEPVADAPTDGDVATTYTVKPGDSAIIIARNFGVNVDDLLATNAVVNRNRVYVGQVLRIPEAST
jgi:LysM repeat protein